MEIAEVKEIMPLLAGAIAAGATLLAVVVTSLFNLRVARLNIEAQSQQRARDLKLQKLEELFFLFDKWQLTFSQIYLHHLRCYKGKLAFVQVMELIKDLDLLGPGDAQKYKMIMDIYFPYLNSAYEPVEAARKKIVPFLSDPSISKLDAQQFVDLQVAFEEASRTFKARISSAAREGTVHQSQAAL